MSKQPDSKHGEDILAAARQVFRQRGYEKARMEDIARLAGVAKGTVYLYFKSKLAILEALVDSYYVMMLEAIVSHLDNPDGGTALKNAVHAGFELANRECDLVVLLDLRLGYAKNRKVATIGNPMALKEIRRFLKRCRGRGELRNYDLDIASVLVGGLLQWITKLCLVWQGDDLARYEDTAVRMLQYALFNNCRKDRK
jgi:AcrR family transcriptional regulator